MDEKDFEDMIAAADQDHDGLISEEEFIQFISILTAHWLNNSSKFQPLIVNNYFILISKFYEKASVYDFLFFLRP